MRDSELGGEIEVDLMCDGGKVMSWQLPNTYRVEGKHDRTYQNVLPVSVSQPVVWTNLGQ
jgi:hypothetical protein